MLLTVLSVASRFPPAGGDGVDGAQQILGRLDCALHAAIRIRERNFNSYALLAGDFEFCRHNALRQSAEVARA